MKKIRMLLPTGAVIGMLVVGTAFPAMAAADSDTAKFVRGTTINAVDVSKQTAQQAKGYLEGYFNEHYEIKIQDADGNLEVLKGTDVGYHLNIGENDCGKSAVIDAIRYVLGTTDQSWQRVELSDYHQENTDNEIHITITFSNLTVREKSAFLECLTYTKDEEILIINWSAKYMTNVNLHRTFVSVNCGRNADVAAPSAEARELLRVTYLKPLRDAQAQMR